MQYIRTLTMIIAMTPALHVLADDPQDILIVANTKVPLDKIGLDDIRNIFLKKQTRWTMNVKAVPVFHGANETLHQHFVERVLEMDNFEEEAYWAKLKIMTGQPPPPKFRNPLRAVFRLNGAVGYVYRSEYREGVAKILLVLPAQ